MGEAKRRREATERREPTEPLRGASGLTFAEIEEIASEDPGDREDRLTHGFSRDDPYETLCRNGCGLTYDDVICGKIRKCLAV